MTARPARRLQPGRGRGRPGRERRAVRAPGCQNQVKAVLPGRTRGRTGGGGRRASAATQRPHARCRAPAAPAASPRAPCAVSPYIDKNPRSRAGAGSAGSCGVPEVGPGIQRSRGSCYQLPVLLPPPHPPMPCRPASGTAGHWAGPARRVPPRSLLPASSQDPQHPGWCPCSGCGWVGNVRGGNGCAFSRRWEPGKKGRCSVLVPRNPPSERPAGR